MADDAFRLLDRLHITGTVVQTAAGNVAMGNAGVCVVNKTVGAATQVTLTARAGRGTFAFVKDGKGDAASHNVTIIPDATAHNTTIDGAANFVISVNYGGALFFNNGTEWNLLSVFDASLSLASLEFLDGALAGTQVASKAVVADANVNTGVSKVTSLAIGASGSEVQVTATPAELNQYCHESVSNVVVITTKVLTAADSGKSFFLTLAGGFTVTLPAPALGLNYLFIVAVAPTTSYIITTNGSANILFGMTEERAGTAGVAGASKNTFNFVANQSIIADWVEFRSDGTNWYYHGMTNIAAGNTVA